MARTMLLKSPLDDTGLHRRQPDSLCTHTPKCPAADSTDREAARMVAGHAEQGWSLLCNGVVVFEDTGDLLPDGQVIAPHRPTDTLDTGEENLFVVYMQAFEASSKHWANCPACLEGRACEVGDSIHAWFAQMQDRYEATQKSDLATP